MMIYAFKYIPSVNFTSSFGKMIIPVMSFKPARLIATP